MLGWGRALAAVGLQTGRARPVPKEIALSKIGSPRLRRFEHFFQPACLTRFPGREWQSPDPAMKNIPARVLALALAVAFPALLSFAAPANPLLDATGNPAGFHALALGDPAPDFSLPGVDGRTYRLADFAGPDVLMVLFTSNHCPTSHGIEGRLKKLTEDFRARSFALVAINPNHPDGLSADELGYGEYGDSFAEMKPYAAKNGWDFPYLYDGDKQLTARAYGCLATPHVFIFDRARAAAVRRPLRRFAVPAG